MRQDRFALLLEKYRPVFIHRYEKKLGYDDASEVVGKLFSRMIRQRSYADIKTGEALKFLNKQGWWACRQFLNDKAQRPRQVITVNENEDMAFIRHRLPDAQQRPDSLEGQPCPFCFVGSLSMYGACPLCHTILPTDHVSRRKVYTRLTKVSLAIDFDYDTPRDVAKALAQLTPVEQAVVKHFGMGNESLESLAEITRLNRMKLCRIWAGAKVKLQSYLLDYAHKTPVTGRKKSFRKALQMIEKQG